jgi:glycosyltransferase involved in cell wall biosynthesis
MHIGLITSRVKPHAGGAFTFEHELLDSLARMTGDFEHKFSVVYRDGRVCDLQGNTIHHGASRVKIKSFIAKRLSWFSRDWRRQSRGDGAHWLDLYLQQIGIDVAWFLSPASRPVSIPYFTVVWDLQHRLQPHFPEVSTKGEWDIREANYGRVLRRASGVFAGTEVGRTEIEKFYQLPKERIHILPHPTPSFALRPPFVDDLAVLADFNLQPGYLFYPAQFWSHKNHAGLLQAIAQLKSTHAISKTLVLVGSDQGNQAHVRQLSQKLGLAEQVRFLNFVTREQLVALYRQAFALTYVSFFGPENLPPLEAFALGCPVIASAVSGSEEQLSGASILVNPHRPDEIAESIATLVKSDSLRKKLIVQGHQRALRFTGDDFVRGAIQAIDRLDSVRQCWGETA